MTAGEPRENGWEELRRKIEALEPVGDAGFYDPRWVSRASVLAIVDRLAAARGEPEIDVERLARAMTNVYEQDLFPIKSDDWHYDATLIAAEYDRLATPTTPEPDQ